jgi:hypothetical protein
LKSNLRAFLTILALGVLQNLSFAQSKYYTKAVVDTFKVSLKNYYPISTVSMVPYSEEVYLKHKKLSKNQYEINYKEGYFSLSDSLNYSVFDTILIKYSAYNLAIPKVYQKHKLVTKYEKDLKDTVHVSEESEPFSTESIFGSGIEKSGTLIRGFTVGTNQDFSLNSGLRLQLSGNLSKDIQVVAALTDQNTPIQPEGNTEKLDELDNVFIQIKHPLATGTFGDFYLQKSVGEFGYIDKKLQGLLGEFHYKDNSAYISIASSQGKFTTNNFMGIDGSQGPYRLYGENNENDIIILAGTEKVYLDGIEMKRGSDNDYTIDYANAEITFTPKRLITSASRIVVDFEYSEQNYARNFLGAGVESKFLDNKVNLQMQFLREGDDQNSPINVTLSDSDKALLAAAGGDRLKASKSGVSMAQPDSLGRVIGTYEQIDTLINGKNYTMYRYAPGSSKALYNVTFSYVGSDSGDYNEQSLGDYYFVGIGKGSYLPVIFLPLPELKQEANIVLGIYPEKDIQLNIELAGSIWDKNRFSDLDNAEDFGYARNIFFNLNPKEIQLGSIDLGKVGFSYKDRYIQSKFTSLGRIDEVEFSRDYDITDANTPENEELREINLNLLPGKGIKFNSMLGILDRGSSFYSDRYDNTLSISSGNLNLNYNLDYVNSNDSAIVSKWLRQSGDGSYSLGAIKPGVQFLSEDKKDKSPLADSLLSTSLKYYEVDPYISFATLFGLDFTMKYSVRTDYAPLNEGLYKQANSFAQIYELKYNGIKEVNSELDFTYNKKKYTEPFKDLGSLDNETILIRSQTRFNFGQSTTGNLYYEVSTQKTAKLQRVFVQVPEGTGNYKYLGDLNNNGIADADEFQPTLYDGNYIEEYIPTDQLYPIIDLKTNTQWDFDFSKIFTGNSLYDDVLSTFSTETQWRVEEESQEQDYSKIYLLNFKYFLNDSTTLNGSNYFQQDLFLFKNREDFSMRFRYSQQKGLNQYSSGVERAYNRERSLRINFKMVKEISNQTDLVNSQDNLVAPAGSNDVREVTSNTVSSDFSYRPEQKVEFGFVIKVGQSQDNYPANPTIINLNSQSLRFTLSFAGSGRFRAEFDREEFIANTLQNYIPFELTDGYQIGKNYVWTLNFDYRITENLQSSISYTGRAEPDSKVIHELRAEARAFF